MKVLAAVVTYNRKDLLAQALEALEASSPRPDILVVDNASTDGTETMLKPWIRDHKIRYRRLAENRGGAGGFYEACSYALRHGYDYVWLLDDDTIVRPDSLQKLLESAHRHPDAGYYSSLALWTDGTENKMNRHRLLEKPQKKQDVRCREATFVSLLVPVPVLQKKGLPISDFFIWGDDIEFSRRISAEQPCYFVPKSVVLHKTASNTGSDISKDDASRLGRYFYAYRNEVFMARKEGLGRMLRQLAKLMFHTSKVLVYSKEEKARKIGLIWKSSWEGLRFNPKIRYK